MGNPKIGPTDLNVVIKFGGGLHTRASEDEIDAREAADGQNFTLDVQNRELRNRPPFDLIGTVPNEGEIRGGASYLKANGSATLLVQAEDDVYEWNGVTTFTDKGDVVSTAQLRGHWRKNYWSLDDLVLITDLNLAEPVLTWDGTDLTNPTFTNENDSGFGDFYAKYCVVSNERAIFSHIKETSSTFGHMMVGSARGDYDQITVSDRPASSLSEEDPFFLLTPDLRSINGHEEAFGTTILSSKDGKLFNLTGASAKDFAFEEFYPGSAASGDESLVYIGNDIIYGRQGRVESVRDTDRFGDSEANDLTVSIADQISGYTGWRSVYNSRLGRVYLFPDGVSECLVFDTAMRGGQLSPWMRWRTTHAMAFQPTFAMSMLDPADGLEYVFMGDSDGNFYRLEGTGESGDGGTNSIVVEWLSKLFSAPLDAQAFDVEGYIKYRRNESATVDLIFEYAGKNIFNSSVTVQIPGISNRPVYGGGLYYSGGAYYGTISGRLSRQTFTPSGQGNEFQVRVRVSGNNDININEIGLRFRAAS